MNRNGIHIKPVQKADPRMPFEFDARQVLTGYLSPQLHKSLRLLPSARKRKQQP